MRQRLATTAVTMLALASATFHLYLIFSGLIPNLISRPIHLAFALPWVFVVGLEARGWRRWLSWLMCLGGVAACVYIAWNVDAIQDQYGSLDGWGQRIMAVFLIVVVLEMARRAIRYALPTVAVLAIAYAVLGQYLPGSFGQQAIPFDSLFGTLVVAEGGLWGPLTGVSVNVVAIFVIFGAVVGGGEGGEAFMALAIRLAGRLRAGAAKVSVLASAFFGSISGSASANVASTGAITLPAMKKLGYPAYFAAAVEATASTGGQVMPPLMGAGAFIMAEFLGTAYTTIIGAAILPALLFFFAVWIGVDLFARRHDLKPMTADEIPPRDKVIRLAPFFLIPFGVLLGVLFGTGRTAQFAAAIAIFISAGLLLFDVTWKPDFVRWLVRLRKAIVTAGRQTAMIASIIICAGLIIGVLNLTGLGVKITSAILTLSGGDLWIALLLTGASCLILGMEVPTTAAYVICVSVAGPALQELGLPALHTHLFVFWYALLSTITPPVCGTVFIAAGMAEASWVRTAVQSMRMGMGLYLIPLAMIANPDVALPVEHPIGAVIATARIAVGLSLLGYAVTPRTNRLTLHILAVPAGLLMLFFPV